MIETFISQQSRKPGSRAFTLVELVVVIMVIALLGCLLLPALAASSSITKEKSQRIACLNNNRQLGLALHMYADDNQDFLPWPNWGSDPSPPCPPGWLYRGVLPPEYSLAVYRLNPGFFEESRTAAISNGVFYKYILNTTAFRCPLDPPGSTNTSWGSRPQQLSSYTMNPGAAFAYPPNNGSGINNGYETAKITSIWSSQCIILWEQGFLPGQGDWNAGSSYPSAEFFGTPHINGGVVLTVGGQAKWMSQTNFAQAAVQPPAGTHNLLWWGIY